MNDESSASKRARLEQLLRSRAAANIVEHPLSYNQRSLWFTYCLAPDSSAYNVPYAFRILSPIDVGALRRALDGLMARHAVLRTTYAANQPVQRVHERMTADLTEVDARAWSDEELHARLVDEARRPFDLQQGPVWRVTLLTRPSDAILLIVLHHIAYDLWSMMTLLSELGRSYGAAVAGEFAAIEPLTHQYSDFARWQAAHLEAEGERLWAYWRRQLAGDLPILDLHADFERPPVQSYDGAMFRREIPRPIVDALAGLARAEGTTLYAVLLAAYQLFLYRQTAQRDVIVGSPVAGRSRTEFERVLGYFLNSLPMRASFANDPDFRTLLGSVRDTVHGALEHQDFPFELMVERLKPPRSAGHTPIFQTMFVLNRLHRLEPEAAGALRSERVELDLATAQFDVSLEIDQLDSGFVARWEYSTARFREETIAEWAEQFEALLAAIAESPTRRASAFPLAKAYVAPRTAAEELVATTFSEVLGVERVGASDSFFALGGDPAKAVEVHLRLLDAAGVDVGPQALFELATVEGLAARLEQLLLAQIDTL